MFYRMLPSAYMSVYTSFGMDLRLQMHLSLVVAYPRSCKAGYGCWNRVYTTHGMKMSLLALLGDGGA